MLSASIPKKRYEYTPRRNGWAVYDESGNKVAEFSTKEEARRECYRLNGWKYKEPAKS